MQHCRCKPLCALAAVMASNTASTHPSGPKRAAPSGFFRHAAARHPTHCSCAAKHRRFSASVASASARARVERADDVREHGEPPARASRRTCCPSEPKSCLASAAVDLAAPASPPAAFAKKIERARQTASFRHLLTDVVVHRGVFERVGDGGEERGIFLGGKPSQRVRQRGRRAGFGQRASARRRRWRDRGDRRRW